MKQYITVEQLKELSEVEFQVLNEYVENPFVQRIAYPRLFSYNEQNHVEQNYIEAVREFNIGKMIEILVNIIPRSKGLEDSICFEIDRTINKSFLEYRKYKSNFKEVEEIELCEKIERYKERDFNSIQDTLDEVQSLVWDIRSITEDCKEQGISMENRLSDYKKAIESLGFIREEK